MPPEPLVFYAIYEHPRDYPHSFVARRWRLVDGAKEPDRLPLVVGPTLEAVREVLHCSAFGLTRLERDPYDDPVIVEVWI
jgi:hypothetical protein